jgi:hypothetical protein
MFQADEGICGGVHGEGVGFVEGIGARVVKGEAGGVRVHEGEEVVGHVEIVGIGEVFGGLQPGQMAETVVLGLKVRWERCGGGVGWRRST